MVGKGAVQRGAGLVVNASVEVEAAHFGAGMRGQRGDRVFHRLVYSAFGSDPDRQYGERSAGFAISDRAVRAVTEFPIGANGIKPAAPAGSGVGDRRGGATRDARIAPIYAAASVRHRSGAVLRIGMERRGHRRPPASERPPRKPGPSRWARFWARDSAWETAEPRLPEVRVSNCQSSPSDRAGAKGNRPVRDLSAPTASDRSPPRQTVPPPRPRETPPATGRRRASMLSTLPYDCSNRFHDGALRVTAAHHSEPIGRHLEPVGLCCDAQSKGIFDPGLA